MDPFARRAVGRTDLRVTILGCGGATLGDGRETIPEAQADLTLEAAYAAGIGYFDTAPWYGRGKSEHRMGRVLRTKARDSFALSTKVGRVLFRPADPAAVAQELRGGALPFDLRFDYTRDGVRRSYEDSLQRLGLTVKEVPIIFVERASGESKMSKDIVLEAVLYILRRRWEMIRGTAQPKSSPVSSGKS